MKEKYWVAVGKSRFSVVWKNQEYTWSDLLSRFQHPTMTQETQAEYLRMGRTRQDGIKDIGGFVGGLLEGGKRSAGTVKLRSLITLDADNANPGLWDEIKMITGYTCAMYTTHKHKPEKPRYRLIFPLTRDVTPDEYEAISRRLAADIGIDYFDDTTYQPSRLMYWPSYSRDGEYLFDTVEGEAVDADAVLATYPDWKDVSTWPVSSRVEAIHRKTAEKQGDPTQKPNPIGAFCRIYDVPAAIDKFLPDVYTDARKDRYTYIPGSTSAGLVLYEGGKFAYSNHATDPAGGRLCNAFDLVRLHLFGGQDSEAKENTPVNKLPSFAAMCELAMQDEAVKRDVIEEKVATAQADFREDISKDDLKTTIKGQIIPCVHNVRVLLRTEEAFDGVYWNLLGGFVAIEHDAKLPWLHLNDRWSGTDDSQLHEYLQHYAHFSVSDMYDGLHNLATARAKNPVKEYLDGLPAWDGIERVDTLLIDYLGAEDTEYVRQVTRKTLCAAIKRIYVPGCKFDTTLVLNGPQGIGKSMLISNLARDWFSDSLSLANLNTVKESGEQLQGVWIMEIGELNGMRKAEVESLRAFLTRVNDKYRPAYGRWQEDHKRMCIFIATTNAEENGYLRDMQGNRRFWDVRVHGGTERHPWDMTDDDIAQIWAEAKQRLQKGEELILKGAAQKAAEEAQRNALETDPRMGMVEEYLDTLLPADWYERTIDERKNWLNSDLDDRAAHPGEIQRNVICLPEIWVECLHKSSGDLKRTDSNDLAGILKKLPGWKKAQKTQRITEYGSQRVWVRTDEEEGLL